MILVFGDFVQYFEYPFHILGLETLENIMFPEQCFQTRKSFENLVYLNGINFWDILLNTLCISSMFKFGKLWENIMSLNKVSGLENTCKS